MASVRLEKQDAGNLENRRILSAVNNDCWRIIFCLCMPTTLFKLELACKFFRALLQPFYQKRYEALLQDQTKAQALVLRGGVKQLLGKMQESLRSWSRHSAAPKALIIDTANNSVYWTFGQLCHTHILFSCGKVTLCVQCKSENCDVKVDNLCRACQVWITCASCNERVMFGKHKSCQECDKQLCVKCQFYCSDNGCIVCKEHFTIFTDLDGEGVCHSCVRDNREYCGYCERGSPKDEFKTCVRCNVTSAKPVLKQKCPTFHTRACADHV